MNLRKSPRSVAALALAALVVLSGCSAVPLSPDDVSAKEIGRQAQQKYESIDNFHGTVTTSITSPDTNRTITSEVWKRPNSNEMRYEYVSPASMSDTVMVSNGSVTWSYNGTENTVRRTELSGVGSASTAPNYSRVLQNVFDRYEVDYEGSESVGDRDAYVIELTPKNESSTGAIEEWTLWIDKDRWFPVKSKTESSFDNRSMTTTTTYTNLTFDTEVPDGTFEFEPPANATVETNEVPEIRGYDSVSEADANVSFDVTEPSQLPDGFELTRAMVSNSSDAESVTLTYENDSGSLVVRQSTQSTQSTQVDADETVTVNGHEAAVSTYEDTTSLAWTCDGRTYSVTGELSTDRLADVGSSLDCE